MTDLSEYLEKIHELKPWDVRKIENGDAMLCLSSDFKTVVFNELPARIDEDMMMTGKVMGLPFVMLDELHPGSVVVVNPPPNGDTVIDAVLLCDTAMMKLTPFNKQMVLKHLEHLIEEEAAS